MWSPKAGRPAHAQAEPVACPVPNGIKGAAGVQAVGPQVYGCGKTWW